LRPCRPSSVWFRLELEAIATEKEPVRLAGIDQAFRFTSGSIHVKAGKL
jgi:hypothetical protein